MNLLRNIVDHKREELAARKAAVKISALSDSEYFAREPLSLISAIRMHTLFGIIAEVKRKSPSAGDIAPLEGSDPGSIAQGYAEHGAAGISVLTDKRFFSGSLEDMRRVRGCVDLPLLRKDFILDEYQIFEAKAAGADAVLLIAAILDASQLSELQSAASELGLEALVEIYEVREIEKIDFDAMPFIGINNRNLRTLEVDLHHSIEIVQSLPRQDITIVSESGIRTPADLKMLQTAGIRAALIGEHFMRSARPGEALGRLLEGLSR